MSERFVECVCAKFGKASSDRLHQMFGRCPLCQDRKMLDYEVANGFAQMYAFLQTVVTDGQYIAAVLRWGNEMQAAVKELMKHVRHSGICATTDNMEAACTCGAAEAYEQASKKLTWIYERQGSKPS